MLALLVRGRLSDTVAVNVRPELEISPEPRELERRAVEQALVDRLAGSVPPAYASPWRRSGLPAAADGPDRPAT
jgi:hypothetical protein